MQSLLFFFFPHTNATLCWKADTLQLNIQHYSEWPPGLTAGDNGIGLPSRCPAFLALNASCNGSPSCPTCKDMAFEKYLWLLCKANKAWGGYLSWGLLNLILCLAGSMAACIFLLRSKSLLCQGRVVLGEEWRWHCMWPFISALHCQNKLIQMLAFLHLMFTCIEGTYLDLNSLLVFILLP